MNLVVSDASPLRYLVAIDAIHILPNLFSKVIVPEYVIAFELQRPKTPPSVRAWACHPPSWVEVRNPVVCPSLNLHTGEEQAIALASELGAPILLDEKEARNIAYEKGLVVVGTIGLLEAAAKRGLLDLPAALEALQQTNMRVHRSLIEAALKRSNSP